VNPPPFLISFPDKAALRAALLPDAIDKYWNDCERLIDSQLPPIVSVRVLSCMFGFSAAFVGAMNRRPERYYRTFEIRKGKKVRTINAPKVALKVIQKWFAHHLSAKLQFSDCVYGFVPGRSAGLAAFRHCNADWVFSADISDFFPTTPQNKIVPALQGIGYPEHGAVLIARLCCYAGNLAQGSPASPILSNLVFSPLDESLEALALSIGATYTRYADDIVLSGRGESPENLATAVGQIIEDGGWTVAKEKVVMAKRPNRLKVHGLLVHNDRPRLTKGYRNRIRALKHLSANMKLKPDGVEEA
jgi:RNA-directed DNA polymerase